MDIFIDRRPHLRVVARLRRRLVGWGRRLWSWRVGTHDSDAAGVAGIPVVVIVLHIAAFMVLSGLLAVSLWRLIS